MDFSALDGLESPLYSQAVMGGNEMGGNVRKCTVAPNNCQRSVHFRIMPIKLILKQSLFYKNNI